MGSLALFEALIRVTGRVQGVGFRPFIYRLAVKQGLMGYVINLGDAGVEIVVEGPKENIDCFISSINQEAPEVSEVKEVDVEYKPFRNRFKEFMIDKSRNGSKAASGIFPPDIGICPECLRDMNTIGSRWYEYPFTACAWCGPRFTGIKSLPYDRERTHMHQFPMCNHCSGEYKDPGDRRFDAQGITCSRCGPRVSLYAGDGMVISSNDPFFDVAKLLKNGAIIAVKGIGGIHLAGIATKTEVVEKLRKRKNRPSQPFAVMSPSLKEVKQFTDPTEYEVKELTSWQRPIVLMRKKGRILSDLVAPELNQIGVMLPYTGIQVMLFKNLQVPALIMTSGNASGVPMSVNNDNAIKELRGIADFFLLHDREIVNRCDDSVLRVNEGRRTFIRRSRGFVPDPIEIPLKGIAIALGAEQSNVGAVTLNRRCFLTQYLGDIVNLEALEYEKNAIRFICDLLKITRNPDVISCDTHPGYMTSHLASEMSQEIGVQVVTSQHHHAHIVSVCAENKLEPDDPVVGIALDGAGYGPDGTVWGGEVLISTFKSYERRGNLEELPMPGGDLCSEQPYRMLVAALTKTLSDNEIRDITLNHIESAFSNSFTELAVILKQSRSSLSLKTSSTGRFLDAVSGLVGLNYRKTYEGEPAMKLESVALSGNTDNIHYNNEITEEKGRYIIKTSGLLNYLALNIDNLRKEDVAAFSQKYLVDCLSEIAIKIANNEGLHNIALSGGVLANNYISSNLVKNLNKYNFNVIQGYKVPPGDGGIALGQTCRALSNVM
ncbi:MAG: carbamoyltransferase HypF [Candidatus Bathyarchaeota archaeon]|nr:carbamoyltransferase HypF [Candidatus Bathyarchaeota archaeon]